MNEFQKVADYILGVSKLSQPQLREHLRNKKKSLEAKRERVQKMFPEGSLSGEFLRIEAINGNVMFTCQYDKNKFKPSLLK